jgi:hypothetical protein
MLFHLGQVSPEDGDNLISLVLSNASTGNGPRQGFKIEL